MRYVCLALCLGGAVARGAEGSAPKEVQAREMELLRRTLAEQQSNPKQIVRTPQSLVFSTNASVVAAHQELEQQFLAGKITAKQFQRGLEQLQQEDRRRAAAAAARAEARISKPAPAPSPSPAAARPAPAAAAPVAATRTAAPPTNAPAPQAVAAPSGAEPTLEQKKISEVEARLEEMLRLKAAREKAALTNAPAAANAPALTKRQKLDALLKELIDGKISKADYDAKRDKLIAEPD